MAKKPTIILDQSILPAMDEYINLVQEKKVIEDRLEEIKEVYKAALSGIWDPEKAYQCGRINVAARQTLELDQLACFKAFENKAKREALFPSAVKFAAGEAKETVVLQGLGKYQWGGPVFTIKK